MGIIMIITIIIIIIIIIVIRRLSSIEYPLPKNKLFSEYCFLMFQ